MLLQLNPKARIPVCRLIARYDNPMEILMVLTSHDERGDTGSPRLLQEGAVDLAMLAARVTMGACCAARMPGSRPGNGGA